MIVIVIIIIIIFFVLLAQWDCSFKAITLEGVLLAGISVVSLLEGCPACWDLCGFSCLLLQHSYEYSLLHDFACASL